MAARSAAAAVAACARRFAASALSCRAEACDFGGGDALLGLGGRGGDLLLQRLGLGDKALQLLGRAGIGGRTRGQFVKALLLGGQPGGQFVQHRLHPFAPLARDDRRHHRARGQIAHGLFQRRKLFGLRAQRGGIACGIACGRGDIGQRLTGGIGARLGGAGGQSLGLGLQRGTRGLGPGRAGGLKLAIAGGGHRLPGGGQMRDRPIGGARPQTGRDHPAQKGGHETGLAHLDHAGLDLGRRGRRGAEGGAAGGVGAVLGPAPKALAAFAGSDFAASDLPASDLPASGFGASLAASDFATGGTLLAAGLAAGAASGFAPALGAAASGPLAAPTSFDSTAGFASGLGAAAASLALTGWLSITAPDTGFFFVSFPGVALFSLASLSGFFTTLPRSLMDRPPTGPLASCAGWGAIMPLALAVSLDGTAQRLNPRIAWKVARLSRLCKAFQRRAECPRHRACPRPASAPARPAIGRRRPG